MFATSLNFFCLVTCFLVMNTLFNCFVPCLLHLFLPLQPCFFFFFFACLFVSRRHFMLFSPLYATMIAIVILVLSSSFLANFVLFLSVCNLYQGQVVRQDLCLNLYPCVIKVQSVSHPVSQSLSLSPLSLFFSLSLSLSISPSPFFSLSVYLSVCVSPSQSIRARALAEEAVLGVVEASEGLVCPCSAF